MKKNYTIYLLFILFLFLLSACKSDEQEENICKDDLSVIKKRGKLIAITGYNSYSYFVYQGRMMGYEYELIKKFADENKLQLELKVVKDIDEMFNMLNRGEGDLIAFSMTTIKEREGLFSFTDTHFMTTQVLVQRRYYNDSTKAMYVNKLNDLQSKNIFVRKGTAYINQLLEIQKKNKIAFNIIEDSTGRTTEDLIQQVADKKIDYTVADENIADLFINKYSNLSVKTKISKPQKVAWVVRKSSVNLLNKLDNWIKREKKKNTFIAFNSKYFQNRFALFSKNRSSFVSKEKGKISVFDNLIKKYSVRHNWDWRLVASLICEESNFNPEIESIAGATGLMQLVPETLAHYGAENPKDPEENIKAGIKYLNFLDKLFSKYVHDREERIKFILAAYNIGPGHIIDAINLAFKYGKNPQVWDSSVETLLVEKSKQTYYNDEVVTNGFCLGKTTIKFVKNVLNRYYEYKKFVT